MWERVRERMKGRVGGIFWMENCGGGIGGLGLKV